MHSLKSRITTLVLVCLAALLVPLVVLSYLFMMEEIDELSDARLAQSARTISALVSDLGGEDLPSLAPTQIATWKKRHGQPSLIVRGHSYESQIGFQYWSDENHLLLNSENMGDVLLDAAPAGFTDIEVGKRHWRVFTLLDDSHNWIRVGERYDSRREIARALAIEAIAPLLIGLPLLALLVGWAVRRGLRPLVELADQLAERRPDRTDPVGLEDLPQEMEPAIYSLNGLLGRVRALLQQERQFTANAAHELRTPLAGALMHVENAQATSAGSASTSLAYARQGLVRLTRLVNQMLELARWDDESAPHSMGAVDLRRCVDEELQELGEMAADKDLEIHVRSDAIAAEVLGWEPGLRSLIRNLLDNAIRYSDDGGRIDVAIVRTDHRTVLSITDNGPGIDALRRESMFDRFQRGPDGIGIGSGLGLAMVARIAQLHRATVELRESEGGRGLRVDVAFESARISPQSGVETSQA
ncbi:MAG: ATP-binding protein [Dokdonella sp.]|uniref:ATP-binding protein n=1 Tax=Dokdonella sp. TaxID=2291710 RepID=UPI003266E97C